MKTLIGATVLFLILVSGGSALAEVGFTQKDRELLIELRVKMEQIDKCFEQVDKRFEQVDQRISDLRQDMNRGFEQLNTFLYILAGIFTTLIGVVIVFAYWDRRTIIREARREAIEFIEKEGILRRMLDALRDMAKEDQRLASALTRFNLL
jgi:DNA-binding NtrC family response regulator